MEATQASFNAAIITAYVLIGLGFIFWASKKIMEEKEKSKKRKRIWKIFTENHNKQK